ncbi:MAG: 30S ribosomal protein S6 [Alphaproteobacteria bacterium]|nr:30S ribosomal protein S6 [Alphaproteobacteria bacterium]
MQRYELTFITRGELSQAQLDEQRQIIAKEIKQNKGSIVDEYDWGLRTLAYPIKRHKKGFYTTLLLEGEQDIIKNIEEKMRLNETILRFLSVAVPSTQEKAVIIKDKEKSNVPTQE